MTYTLSLIRAVEEGKITMSINELIKYARYNKILLHFLRRLNIKGDIRDREEYRYRGFRGFLIKLNSILSKLDCDYAFFKLYKPIKYIPADIDILVSIKDIKKVARELLKNGFSLEVLEPYTITLTMHGLIVDLYTYPSLGNITYLNGQKLLEHRTRVDYDGIEMISLNTYAEAVVTLAHAIDKEWIYTLNDYYTISMWLDNRALNLCRELDCMYEARLALSINKMIEEGIIETPYKIPNIYKFKVWSRKFKRNPLVRSTSIKILLKLGDKRLGKSVLSKLSRETY